MNIFNKLFQDPSDDEKLVSSREIKIALMGAKRDKRKKRLELNRLNTKQSEIIARIKKYRRDGDNDEVDFQFDELQQNKLDIKLCRRESKILNLEAIGLQRYLRAVERSEKTSNVGRIRDLMKKMQSANLQEKLQGQVIDEESYMDSLKLALDDVQAELEDVDLEESSEKNAEKEKFLRELDEIIEAEEEDPDLAEKKEADLISRVEKDLEDPSF